MRGNGALRAAAPYVSCRGVPSAMLSALLCGRWNDGCIKKQKIRSRVLNIRREKCGKNASERTDGLFGPKKVNFDKIGNSL